MKKLRDYKKDVKYTDFNKTGVDMRIDYPGFDHFSHLQDAVMAFLMDLPSDERQKFLDKYGQPDLGWLHMSLLSFQAWIDVASDIDHYVSTR